MKIRKNKAQAWSFDLMVAISIFVVAISLFYFYSINVKSEGQDILSEMQYDGNAAADLLLSDGYPTNWDTTPNSVIVPGILTDKKVDENKLIALNSLTEQKQHSLIHTNYNFCLNFSESLPSSITNNCIGKSFNNPQNLFLISRLTIYKNKSSLMNLYIWK